MLYFTTENPNYPHINVIHFFQSIQCQNITFYRVVHIVENYFEYTAFQSTIIGNFFPFIISTNKVSI